MTHMTFKQLSYGLISMLIPCVCLGEVKNFLEQEMMETRALTPDEQTCIAVLNNLRITGCDAVVSESIQFGGMPICIGVYALIIKDNQMLMVHTPSGSKNCINFPGGGVDVGEGFIEALKRECREELGVNIEAGKLLYSSKSLYVHEDFPHNYMYHLYFLATTNDVVSAEAELKAEWFPVANPPLDAMLPIDKEFIATFGTVLF